ncbi:sialate O-acetylesterase [Flavivirga sp. 57AJ16]|uniref:sialate O-acetylesterase n=1 Tax=Flavivirga sp. 57AJ16 TaxID=3025307 RepID=UPI002366E517|nr:sialate O-acetylesterase [Flavivirga sp. 57AJ16]MDD7885440.1 sialate O-acetylesterase [Flavivirga sp. 57AJ16]
MKKSIQLLIRAIILFAFISLGNTVFATIKLPSIFGSNMVLQRNSEVSIWGTANSKSNVSVTTSWNNQTYEVKSDKKGNWKIKVSTPEAGGPYTIKISDGQELVLDNVLIGEVWVCSGQSNMEWSLKRTGHPIEDPTNNTILKSANPDIRLFTVEKSRSLNPENDLKGNWNVCGPATSTNFSATAYYFGKMLQETIGVPIGLISSNWGGTRVEAWIDEEGLREYDVGVLEDQAKGPEHNVSTTLFNAMINPMLGFNIAGVIWYQGESNITEADVYAERLELMVRRWRELWGVGEFPFYYCQIAPYEYGGQRYGGANSAFLREAQLEAYKKIPNSGMVSLMDTGEELDIHPNNKRTAGERLAYFALSEVYGVEGIYPYAPELDKIDFQDSKAILTFKNIPTGLTSYTKNIEHFEIAGEDRIFYPAHARVIGRGRNRKQIEVSVEKVPNPVAVRYAFKNFVMGSFYNWYGIPASSFRTDDWDDAKTVNTKE